MPIAVLYTKEGCSLCARAKEILLRLREETSFHLEEVDITRDATLFAAYKNHIPVVTVDGKEVMRGTPDELALRQGLGLDL
jgi:glutaredoxin